MTDRRIENVSSSFFERDRERERETEILNVHLLHLDSTESIWIRPPPTSEDLAGSPFRSYYTIHFSMYRMCDVETVTNISYVRRVTVYVCVCVRVCVCTELGK